jgi:hypothetical protein
VFARHEIDEDELRQKEATPIDAENIATIDGSYRLLYLGVLESTFFVVVLHCRYVIWNCSASVCTYWINFLRLIPK